MRALAGLLALGWAGCGIGWVDGAGTEGGTPTAGIGPYRRLVADDTTPVIEPWVLIDPEADLSGPTVLARAGGGLRVWFTRTEVGGAPEIWYAELASLGAAPTVPPRPALVAELAWEAGAVSAPSVVELGGQLIMLYQGGQGEPAIGRAVSDDDGATWQRDVTALLPEGQAPAALVTGADELLVIGTRAEQLGLWLARGVPLRWQPAPIVAPRTTRPEAFDRDGVSDPTTVTHVSPGGDLRVGLWFTGTVVDAEDDPPSAAHAIGYAGSLDGLAWVRPASDDPGLRAEARDPAVLLEGDQATMLFVDTYRGRAAIGAATTP